MTGVQNRKPNQAVSGAEARCRLQASGNHQRTARWRGLRGRRVGVTSVRAATARTTSRKMGAPYRLFYPRLGRRSGDAARD